MPDTVKTRDGRSCRVGTGTGVSCYFGESEGRGVRNGVRADGELSWEQRDYRGYDLGF